MRIMRLLRLGLGLSALLVGIVSAPGQDEATVPAEVVVEDPAAVLARLEKSLEKKALDWLALIDGRAYGKSWDESSPFLRGAYLRDVWERSLKVAITPLGAVQSRALRAVEDRRGVTMPGGPKAHYMIVRFDTVYENKETAEESLTFLYMHDNGGWRVVGYFVK